MGVSRREPLYQTTARPHELYCNEVSSRIIADLRDERDQLNEAILARMPFHGLSVQFLTNGGVTPVLTDRGTGFCGQREHHEYQLYLSIENIDDSHTKA